MKHRRKQQTDIALFLKCRAIFQEMKEITILQFQVFHFSKNLERINLTINDLAIPILIKSAHFTLFFLSLRSFSQAVSKKDFQSFENDTAQAKK